MILVAPAPYAPFMDRRTEGPPGLSPLDKAEFIVVHDDFADQMRYRTELLAAHPDIVLGCLPEGRAPADELLQMLLKHLAGRTDYAVSDVVRRPDGVTVEIDRERPLETICHLASEDFCLLLPDAASREYRLVAAILCFPSRWLLSEKLGRPMTVIHEPVPRYDDTLARRVNRVFETLRADRPLVRVNWLIHATPELYLPLGLSDKLMTEADPTGPLYLRTERQTLVRMPETGAVCFGIKTSVTPLEDLRPDEAAALSAALGRLDPETVLYKGAEQLMATAQARLDRIAGVSHTV